MAPLYQHAGTVGLYVYNGKFVGILMRMCCEENIIVAHENERTVPVFVVKGKK